MHTFFSVAFALAFVSDQKVYIDVDDMKHLASGQGRKHRVDEIILPQKAYKGGGLCLRVYMHYAICVFLLVIL